MIKHLLLTGFVISTTFSYSQEELNEEDNWKLFPGAKDSSMTQGVLQESPSNDSLSNYEGPAFVEIIQDYRIKQLLEKDKFIKDKPDTPQIDGFRIKIYFGSGPTSQQEANQAKAKFLEAYPDVAAIVDWSPPNYVTLIGNFRTKMEAEKFLLEISSQFPEGFIVPSLINLPEIN